MRREKTPRHARHGGGPCDFIDSGRPTYGLPAPRAALAARCRSTVARCTGRFLLFFVDDELQDIRAGIVPHRVVLHLADGGEVHIQVGHDVTQPVWDKGEIIYADLDMNRRQSHS